jgi:ABC-type maltose transport system permease subunit
MESSDIWGPNFWYVLHMMAFHYPQHPNKITKKKYYDTIMNFPLFLPNQDMGDRFSKLLDTYPISPYLDSRESFIKWTHFIHNKVNEQLSKPQLSYSDFISMYTYPVSTNEKTTYFSKYKNTIIVALLVIIILLIYKLV